MDINKVYNYINNHKTTIILISIILIIVYFFIGNFYGLFATYNCLTTDFLWKIANGKLTNCFKGDPKQCKNIDKYGIYGFCYEPNYYGTGMGQKEGPYGYNCVDWVFDSKDCYPETCELANSTKKYGWCVERNRAYLGNSCGPSSKYGIRCKDWIWTSPEKCPKKCPIIPKEPPIIIKPKPKISKKVKICPRDDECICE